MARKGGATLALTLALIFHISLSNCSSVFVLFLSILLQFTNQYHNLNALFRLSIPASPASLQARFSSPYKSLSATVIS